MIEPMSKRKPIKDEMSGFLSGQGNKPAASASGEIETLERNTIGLPKALSLKLKRAELDAGEILGNSKIKKYELIIAAVELALDELAAGGTESDFIKYLSDVIKREYRYPQ
jgi:hypothetical protein